MGLSLAGHLILEPHPQEVPGERTTARARAWARSLVLPVLENLGAPVLENRGAPILENHGAPGPWGGSWSPWGGEWCTLHHVGGCGVSYEPVEKHVM